MAGSANDVDKQALRVLLQRRAQLVDDLKTTERQIWDLEESYIDETINYGNVIKGWESFLNSKSKHQSLRKPSKIPEKYRIFSLSSATAPITNSLGDDTDGSDMGRSHRIRAGKSTRNKLYSYSDDEDELYTED